jgi:hypothetical protein
MTFLRVDLSSLNTMLHELGDAAEAAARPAAQAAAQVLYDGVVANVEAIGQKSGNLRSSVYQVYSQDHSGPGFATYHVSWNHRKAPHGHLLEAGYIQRYASYIGKDGRWHTAIRASMQGTRKPSRTASQAVKDSYYVPRPGGPVQWIGKAFVRRAATKFPQAIAAAEAVLLKAINDR